MNDGKIAMIVSGFPRLSETFAVNELLALEARGALTAIFATKPGDMASLQPGTERLLKRVQILPRTSPAKQAAIVVQRLGGQRVRGVHGYFAHTPAEVASRTAERLGVPYGFSVHARDARKVADTELAERAHHAACVVACNPDVAQDIRRSGASVHLIPHGVDLKRFRPSSLPPAEPLRILAVGRLVEKKGFHFLLAAVSRLSLPFRLRIIGEGPERERLTKMIADHELGKRVTLCGGRTHEDLPEEYRLAHVVVAPSILDQTGDRDGLPNVILEAMASQRPVIATDIGAIGSAVVHAETGILVPPADAVALAFAVMELGRQPALCAVLGRNARKRVERDYEAGHCAERFYRLLEDVYS